jgi:hypothetical protein
MITTMNENMDCRVDNLWNHVKVLNVMIILWSCRRTSLFLGNSKMEGSEVPELERE